MRHDKNIYIGIKYFTNYLVESSSVGLLHSATCFLIMSGSISKSHFVKALSFFLSFSLDVLSGIKNNLFQQTFKIGKEEEVTQNEVWCIWGVIECRNLFF